MRKPIIYLFLSVLVFATELYAEEAIIPHFDINRYILEGNTALTSENIDKILGRFTGKNRDFGDIQQAIEVLEASYKKLGYNLVTVLLPEQELEKGEIRITVIEPRIKEVTVEGNKQYSRDNILNSIPNLRIGEMPNLNILSENMRAANENPGKKAVIQFQSLNVPQELKARIKVTDQRPLKLFASADNTGTIQSGEYRLGIGVQHYNLFDLDHIMALQYQTSADYPSRVSIASGSYRIPFYTLGDTLDVYAGYSNVDNGTSQISGTDIQVSGQGIVAGVRYNLNLRRLGNYEHKLLFGADYRFYDNSALLSGSELASDVTTHPFSLTYILGVKKHYINIDGYLGVIHNEPWGHKGSQKDFENSKNGANPRYWIIRYGTNIMAKPVGDWLARFVVNAQYSDDRLISGEQLGLGGASSVRGYQEREESFDAGFYGSAELYTPDLAKILSISGAQIRLVAFYDAGYGYNNHIQYGDNRYNTLESAGAGLRVHLDEYFSFAIDGAVAMSDTINYKNLVFDIHPTKNGDNRIHFKAQITY